MRRRLFGIFSRRLNRSRLRRPPFGAGESLEQRSMLSASFDAGTGVLTLVGTERNDTIALSPVKAGRTIVNGSVKVSGVAGVSRGQVFTGVRSVEIQALGGNDKVTIASGLKAVDGTALAVLIDAGNGQDVVQGGDGADTILGGAGKDVIRGGRGDDSIDGGGGGDNLQGDDGDDLVVGGVGKDQMRGGRGKDTLYGGSEDDKLFGDAGDDDLDGGLGNDDLFGGRGNDDDVDDNDSLDDRDDDNDEDRGDNDNEDEDENEDDDDDNGSDDEDDDHDADEDDEDDDDGDDDDPVGTPLTFATGTESLTGTSANKNDKIYYSFVIPVGETWSLQVVMNNVDGGRYADLEIERQGAGPEVEYEIEPQDGDPTTATFAPLSAGRYSVRLRAPGVLPVTFSVDLTQTVV